MKRFVIFFLTLHASLFTLHLCSAQDTIYVPQDYPTIQQGINAADSGDLVLVDDSTYYENINFNGKAITLASYFLVDGDTNHINNTIIDGSQPADPDLGSVITFNSGEDTSSVLYGFTITGGTGTLYPLELARSGGGILCYDAGAKIINNTITLNQINHTGNVFGGGIALSEGSDHWVIFENNRITHNSLITTGEYAYGGGIYSDLNTRINDNLITNNIIEGNDAVGGGVMSWSPTGSNHIILVNNTISNNEVNGHWIWGGGVGILSSSAIIKGNQFNGNVIDCERGWGGGAWTQGTTDSLYVTNNEISGNHIYSTDFCVGGGALFHSPFEYACYADNIFSDNIAEGTSYGGGLTFNNSNDVSISIEGNIFSENSSMAGGGIYSGASNSRITNNLFSNNSVDGSGGGVFVTITTKENSGPDIWQVPWPEKETVSEISRAANMSFVNNTFVGNSAAYNGGAIRCTYTTETCEIINSIFWENTASVGNDIHYSGTEEIYLDYSDIDTLNVFGSWTGEGNFYADPAFVDADPLFHLSSVSPCRDTGILASYTPLSDFDGDDRPDPVSELVDIGADEFYEIPEPPVATEPESIGDDFFIASWEESAWAHGYFLDVSYDPDFEDFLEGFENLDVGDTTLCLVSNLNSMPYYYRVRAYNSAGVSENSNSIAVLSVNIDELKTQNSKLKIDIYPNPTREIFDLRFTIYSLQSVSCSIYDLHGREVARVLDKNLPAGEHTVRCDMTGLPAGVYIVELRAKGGEQRAVSKLVVR